MDVVQPLGPYEAQFRHIIANAIDKRKFIDVTTGTANTEFSAEHGLNFIPNGYFVIQQDKAGDVYLGTTAWDVSKIYLRASVATMALRILIF